jgi:hypothetical protein
VTGEAIEAGQRRVVVLLEPEGASPELRRVEVGVESWRAGRRPAGRVFAFWSAVREGGAGPTRALIDDDELMDLFEQMAAAEEPAAGVGAVVDAGADALASRRRAVFRYLLALVLIRKKKLVYEGGHAADRKRGVEGEMRLRVRAGKEQQGSMPMFRVPDPGLSDEDVAAATEELGKVMNLDDALPGGGGA